METLIACAIIVGTLLFTGIVCAVALTVITSLLIGVASGVVVLVWRILGEMELRKEAIWENTLDSSSGQEFAEPSP